MKMLLFQLLVVLNLFLTSTFDVRTCPPMNKALLELQIKNPEILTHLKLWHQYKVCQNCTKLLLSDGTLTNNGKRLLIDSDHEYDFMVTYNNSTICQDFKHPSLEECGHYKLEINIQSRSCKIGVVRPPVDSKEYLFIAFVLLILGLQAFSSFNQIKFDVNSSRVYSLDAYRGFCVFWMIFFNYGSGGYKFLKHSDWHGLTPADLVFPWFIWIMGFSIPISIQSLIENKHQTKPQLFLKILTRSTKLLLTGILVFSVIGPRQFDLAKIRIPGVLQRIAACYLLVATLELLAFKPKKPAHLWTPILAIFMFSSAWVFLTYHMPIPGCPPGYMRPGGLEHHSKYFNCTGGSAAYIDNLLFGRDHLYSRGSIKAIYKTYINFDPEGFLGTLNAVVLTYIGAISGRITLIYSNKRHRVLVWILMSLGFFGLFYALTGFKLDDETFPVNKSMWTLGYNLIMASSSLVMMSVFYYIIDIQGDWRSLRPFVYLGLNSTIVYVMHYLFSGVFPLYWPGVPYRHSWQLAMNLWGSCFWTLFAGCLHYKKIHLNF